MHIVAADKATEIFLSLLLFVMSNIIIIFIINTYYFNIIFLNNILFLNSIVKGPDSQGL